jgi:hypothetical protein
LVERLSIQASDTPETACGQHDDSDAVD